MKWKCIKREPGLDITIDKIYEENEFLMITDDSGCFDINPLANKDLFNEVDE